MGRIIGIDLGTTNSVAAFWSRRRAKTIFNSRFHSPITPSVVAWAKGETYVGQDAKDRFLDGSGDVIYSIKRLIGRTFKDPNPDFQKALEKLNFEKRENKKNGEVEVKLGDRYISPVEISAMILTQLKKDAESELGEEVTHAVITVPAYFGQRQKNATREAGKLAGLHVLRMINEPTAAALSFGIDEASSDPINILVYDMGGGTFDISALMFINGNFEVLATQGKNFEMAGDDMDELIVQEMLAHLKMTYDYDFSGDKVLKIKLKGKAEEAKIQLSRESEARIVYPTILHPKTGRPVNLDFLLTRFRFEQLIDSMVRESIDITLQAIKEASWEIDQVDRVLLVGGATRVPLVRERLRAVFGNKLELEVDPMHCVALGAAIQTSIPIEWMCTHCNTINQGTDDHCHQCRKSRDEDADIPVIFCDDCKRPNRQGSLHCWNCGVQIGAMTDFEDSEESSVPLRVGDITAKHLGIEVVSQSSDQEFSRLHIVVPKGTPFPMQEPYLHELYTSHSGQTEILLPIYEVEDEKVPFVNWEHVGRMVNDKVPPGMPVHTPVTVEIWIDPDGLLFVSSYLKKMRENTYIRESFRFGEQYGKETPESIMDLWFQLTYMKTTRNLTETNRFLSDQQKKTSDNFIKRAQIILDSEDEEAAQNIYPEIKNLTASFPAPIHDLFWAYWVSDAPEIQPSEKSQLLQTVNQMNQAITENKIEVANQHLNRLRTQTEILMKKIPTNLLKARRD